MYKAMMIGVIVAGMVSGSQAQPQTPIEPKAPVAYVTGKVGSPGVYPFTEGLTVAALVERAGESRLASPTILIIRRSPLSRAAYCIAAPLTKIKAGDTVMVRSGPHPRATTACDSQPVP